MQGTSLDWHVLCFISGVRLYRESERREMFDRTLLILLTALLVLGASCGWSQELPVATAPWGQFGQGPDRTFCSPYAGPLNKAHESMPLLPFSDEPLTLILLGRDGLLQTVSEDDCLYKFSVKHREDSLVMCIQLPWTPTDMAIGYDGTTFISTVDDGYARLAAFKNDLAPWEKSFRTRGEIYVVPLELKIVVLLSDGRLFCLTTDGEEEWNYTVPGIFDRCTMPSIARSGIIYFSTNGVTLRSRGSLKDSCLYAVSRDGVLLWDLPAPVESLSYPVIDESENIYVIGSDGLLYSFCSSGLNWAEPAAKPQQDAHLAYYPDMIIVLSDGSVTTFSKTGQRQPLWSVSLGDPFISAPVIGSDGITYALTRPILQGSLPTLTAIGIDGNVRWSVPVNHDTQTPPIITIEGDICLGTSEGVPVYFGCGRGDITPPHLAETFPPKDTIVPLKDFNLMITLLDDGVGIIKSSIYVSVNDEFVHTTTDDVVGGYQLSASPRQILAPFQDVTIEVSAEDKRFNSEIEPYHLTAVDYKERPTILMAGFGYSSITSSKGGQLRTVALIDPLTDIKNVVVYHTPSGFSQTLWDTGTGVYFKLKGRWYSADCTVPAGIPPGYYELEIAGEDTTGKTGCIWPYLTVEREDDAAKRGLVQGAGTPLELPASRFAMRLVSSPPTRPYESASARNGNPPFILAAGYTYSYMTTSGGVVRIEALVDDPDGVDDVETVEVFVDGYPTGLFLRNDGMDGDGAPEDNVFTYQIFLGSDVFASGRYLYELKAFDWAGNESNIWPYIEIKE